MVGNEFWLFRCAGGIGETSERFVVSVALYPSIGYSLGSISVTEPAPKYGYGGTPSGLDRFRGQFVHRQGR